VLLRGLGVTHDFTHDERVLVLGLKGTLESLQHSSKSERRLWLC
jgi:hypothetical protein